MLALPRLRESKWLGAGKNFLCFIAPATLHKIFRCDTSTAQEFLHLITRQRSRCAENTQELPRHRLDVTRWPVLHLSGIFINQLIDTEQGFTNTQDAAFIHVDLAVVTREILQCLAAPDYLDVRSGQTFLGVVLQHRLQLAHIGHHLAAHPAPAHRLGFFGALTADVDDVVLDGLGAELAFALGFVRADGVSGLKVVTRIEQ